MSCGACISGFFFDSFRMWLSIGSLSLSILALGFLTSKNTKTKLTALYIHTFFLLFPIILYLTYSGCTAMLGSCETIKQTITLAGITSVFALLSSAILAPFLFIKRIINTSKTIGSHPITVFIARVAEQYDIIPPTFHIINTAIPIAFSFSLIKSRIFISVGLADILTYKELEAVLLHEFAHIKQQSSLIALSRHIAYITPIAWFTIKNELNNDEQNADKFAMLYQKTSRHIRLAKAKIDAFMIKRRLL
ncbi:MAG: M56 family metallopeptidase [Nanoarchaeota archaeon]